MNNLTIKQADLLQGFHMSDMEGMAYLDSHTGAVMIVASESGEQDFRPPEADTLEETLALIDADTYSDEGIREMLIDAARIEFDTEGRYLLILPQTSRDGYGDMRAFVDSLGDTPLADRLDIAIQGSGAFRRFKDTVAHDPQAEQAWYAFRDARELVRAKAWLDDEGITATLV